jgi:CRISPR-associated endonuclease/helicase Cas3
MRATRPTFPHLLAKSVITGQARTDSHTLPRHLLDVYAAARRVLAHTGCDQIRSLGLPAEWRERLHRAVLLAAALHDLGKANEHFQLMLLGQRSGLPQGLRHEWVSIRLVEEPALREWLLPAVNHDRFLWRAAQWAVAGHHPAFDRPSPPVEVPDGAGHTLRLLVDHRDFRRCVDWLRQELALASPPPPLAIPSLSLTGSRSIFAWIAQWRRDSDDVWEQLDEPSRRLVAAIKSSLIACDVAGSALPQVISTELDRDAWIDCALTRTPTGEQLDRIVERKLDGKELRLFQSKVAESRASVTFVQAGCGSGKTLAAYHWAARRHSGRRLYFCYPTTGTATEGYRDYLYAPEEDLDADLFHGRASVDLESILGSDADEPSADDLARIESLDAWSTPVVSCTVDTVLGLVQNNRRGLYAWPALAGAAFVFDEIHAYDERLFGSLLRFLQELPGAPVLLMTASLPVGRRQALEQCLARRGLTLATIPGPPELENRRRYHRRLLAPGEDELALVKTELAQGGKVLWVCNTVGRAMETADRAAGLRPLLYHSRFRYEDRVQRHRAVIAAFEAEGAALAVCTQVAEMSLDLSATLLVVDLAPVPALIQRLGRLNRRAREGDPTRPVVVIDPGNHLPYTAEELSESHAWLSSLGDRPLSQADLANAWAGLDRTEAAVPVDSAWLDGGPCTKVCELREATPGITVVLARDEPALRRYQVRIGRERWEATRRGQPLDAAVLRTRVGEKMVAQVALPMPPPPRALNWRAWPRFRRVPVAPEGTIDYHPLRGGEWQR